MALIGNETKELMQELYVLAKVQESLDEQELTMAIDWTALRRKLEKALVHNGIELP